MDIPYPVGRPTIEKYEGYRYVELLDTETVCCVCITVVHPYKQWPWQRCNIGMLLGCMCHVVVSCKVANT
jgi:hypothetical protein